MSDYFDALCEAMEACTYAHRPVFMGQGVAYPGTFMSRTLKKVPDGLKLELPVFENMQMGMATGWALDGGTPISLYPRWDFLMCAMDQLVNHLDKLPLYSAGGWRPRVIIRVGVGAQEPLFPGHQHIGDYTQAMRHVLNTIDCFALNDAADIMPRYKAALSSPRSTILVEYANKY